MPSDKYDLIGRVKAVEREHTALRFTTDRALRSLGEGAVDLEEGLKRLDVYRASERLEGTYIIRLFSEFEVALKTILRERKVKKPKKREAPDQPYCVVRQVLWADPRQRPLGPGVPQ